MAGAVSSMFTGPASVNTSPVSPVAKGTASMFPGRPTATSGPTSSAGTPTWLDYMSGHPDAPAPNASTAPTTAGYSAPIAAGNGTYGNMGTNLVTPAQAVPGVTSGAAYNPSADPSTFTAPTPSSGSPTQDYGSESGPGILQQWFGERANGTDPGWEYETKRNATALNNQYAARGGFDSGAALQGQGDLYANEEAQREGQLDSLAAGASGERSNQVSQMLGLGMGLGAGGAGVGTAYDTAGANAMSGANNTGLGYGAQGTALQYQANQGLMHNLLGL